LYNTSDQQNDQAILTAVNCIICPLILLAYRFVVVIVDKACRLEDNIKMDLQEVECGGMNWIQLAQDWDRWWTRVNVVMNLRVP